MIDNPVLLADLGASLSAGDPKDLQAIIEELNVSLICTFSILFGVLNLRIFQISKRLLLSLSLLKKELETTKLQHQIGKEVEEKVKQQHRKYILNEQLKVIKRELGIEKDDKDAINDKYRELIKDKIVPAAVSKVIDEELTKLGFLESHSSEFK